MQVGRGDHFLFGSIFIKKISKPEFFSLKKTETDSNWFDSIFSVWLDFFGLARFWLGFFQFGLVFSVWLGFGSVFFWFLSVWVRFGFFSFRLIKPKPNRTSRLFQNLNWFNRFVFTVRFFLLFFPIFSVFRFFWSPL
jgi:hypothetical protein